MENTYKYPIVIIQIALLILHEFKHVVLSGPHKKHLEPHFFYLNPYAKSFIEDSLN